MTTEESIQNLKCIRIEQGGFFQGVINIRLDFLEDGNIVSHYNVPRYFQDSFQKKLSPEDSKKIKKLLLSSHFNEWGNYYSDPNVLDGWSADFTFLYKDGTKKTVSCSNKEPKGYSSMYKIIEMFRKLAKEKMERELKK